MKDDVRNFFLKNRVARFPLQSGALPLGIEINALEFFSTRPHQFVIPTIDKSSYWPMKPPSYEQKLQLHSAFDYALGQLMDILPEKRYSYDQRPDETIVTVNSPAISLEIVYNDFHDACKKISAALYSRDMQPHKERQ